MLPTDREALECKPMFQERINHSQIVLIVWQGEDRRLFGI